MEDQFEHWYYVALGLLLFIFFIILYWAMLKSAYYMRYRVYTPEQTLPILDESSSATVEKKKTNQETGDREEDRVSTEGQSVLP